MGQQNFTEKMVSSREYQTDIVTPSWRFSALSLRTGQGLGGGTKEDGVSTIFLETDVILLIFVFRKMPVFQSLKKIKVTE